MKPLDLSATPPTITIAMIRVIILGCERGTV
jgi:hypothetical protein